MFTRIYKISGYGIKMNRNNIGPGNLSFMLCHLQWNMHVDHRPLFCIHLCLVLSPPSSSTCICILLSTFLSPSLFSQYSSVTFFICGLAIQVGQHSHIPCFWSPYSEGLLYPVFLLHRILHSYEFLVIFVDIPYCMVLLLHSRPPTCTEIPEI